MLKLGIDVGGTNTDAVVMQDGAVIFSVKTPTSGDVFSGVVKVLADVQESKILDADQLGAVMIGTTHFTNALVERRGLSRVGVIRLALPATQSLPPLSGWPEDLIRVIDPVVYLAAGGFEFDASEISPLDPEDLTRIVMRLKESGIRDVAIAGVFSSLNDAQERYAAEIVQRIIPDARVTLGSVVGRLGLLERENAAILNAALGDLGESVIAAFERALAEAGFKVPFFLTQNDGTLMDARRAARLPILTVASGPTNSMRGAAFLSGCKDAIVVDIGGTTTDVGLLQKGFPRQAGIAVEVGGVRTNFRMPDVYSIGLGGGSHVDLTARTIGPQSVGYRLPQLGTVFGGKSLTASDIVVAAGIAQMGDPALVHHLPSDQVEACVDQMQQMILDAIERVRLSSDPIALVVVGGGSVLAREFLGEIPVLRPNHFSVANAVGAAMAQVSGESDRIYRLDESTREEILADALAAATSAAINAGAEPGSITTVDIDEIPLAYMGNALRVRVKVVGDLVLRSEGN